MLAFRVFDLNAFTACYKKSSARKKNKAQSFNKKPASIKINYSKIKIFADLKSKKQLRFSRGCPEPAGIGADLCHRSVDSV